MESIRILVADDEKEIQLLLKKYLQREGYEVDCVNNGEEALNAVRNHSYELIILDIMMPEIDGMEVCRMIRDHTTAPIFMVTAKDDEIDKVLGLSIGADDYITKPFSVKELVARVKAHLRKIYLLNDNNKHKKEKDIIKFQNIKIDVGGHSVCKNDVYINLTVKEFELLKLFANYPGQVFTKSQIFNQVWGDEYLSDDNTVMVHIRRLRKKIEDEPDNPKLIQTIWGIGYKFTGDTI